MRFLVKLFNRISIKKKLVIMMLFCVIFPLVFTDGVVLITMIRTEKKEDNAMMQNVADSIKFTLSGYTSSAFSFLQSLSNNKSVASFIDTSYADPISYYDSYYELKRNIPFSNDRCLATIYSNGDGIISGGNIQQLSKATSEKWYKEFVCCKDVCMLYVDYAKVNWDKKRVISLIANYNHYDTYTNNIRNIIKVDMDYSDIQASIENAKYSLNAYVCYNNKIIFSNDKKGGLTAAFLNFTQKYKDSVRYSTSITLYDKTLDIYVFGNENITLKAIEDNKTLLSVILLLNIILPIMIFRLLSRSFTERLRSLTESIKDKDAESLKLIQNIDGTDEISVLMQSYNDMATRINNLIVNEYKERLKRQEIDIARQRAELLALHSQINPHFLFNALESIRMHSVIKKEDETARMVEKLAIMQRQNVQWGNDSVTVEDEIKFVEAYLELQKYRFGNKLMYEINVDRECSQLRIPRITLVTFVENACVHGMEKKTSSSWVFVRVSKDADDLVLEVEDTGCGFPEGYCREMLDTLRNVNIEMLQGRKGIGILNAALRLKMHSNDKVKFELESEVGVGTLVSIRIPLEEIGGLPIETE